MAKIVKNNGSTTCIDLSLDSSMTHQWNIKSKPRSIRERTKNLSNHIHQCHQPAVPQLGDQSQSPQMCKHSLTSQLISNTPNRQDHKMEKRPRKNFLRKLELKLLLEEPEESMVSKESSRLWMTITPRLSTKESSRRL